MKAIMDWLVGSICGCISNVRVHCSRNPLHPHPREGCWSGHGTGDDSRQRSAGMFAEVTGDAGQRWVVTSYIYLSNFWG